MLSAPTPGPGQPGTVTEGRVVAGIVVGGTVVVVVGSGGARVVGGSVLGGIVTSGMVVVAGERSIPAGTGGGAVAYLCSRAAMAARVRGMDGRKVPSS